MQEEQINKISFLSLFGGIFYNPFKTWKKIARNNYYKYTWIVFWIIVELSVVPYAFLSTLDLLFAFLIINSGIWIALLIQWGMINAGLNIAGVKTNFTFTNNIRLYSYNNVIFLLVIPVAIIRVLIAPKSVSLVEKFPHYLPTPEIDIVYSVVFVIYSIWFLALLIISVKNVLNISYKRASFAVLLVPGIIGLIVLSFFLLHLIF